jgi:replication factor C subunit 3/5
MIVSLCNINNSIHIQMIYSIFLCNANVRSGPSASKVKVTVKQFKAKAKTIEISTITSNYHIEINPSDVARDDKVVIQEVIKEIAQSHNVNISSSSSATSDHQFAKQFKVVVLTEVDRLSRQAQNALRRTMERYTSTCRLILVCSSASRLIAPLKSRCLPIRLPAPTIDEITRILKKIATKENLQITDETIELIAMNSDRNLRRAILMLEVCI